MSSKIINITESAEKYLAKLLKDKNETDIAVRIFISDPGTPRAETCLAYCKPDEAEQDDIIINLKLITVHIEKRSMPFLVDAEVNFDNDTFGGQLTIKAPNANLNKEWTGQSLDNKTLLILEEGNENLIQFVRFAKELHKYLE